MTTQGEDLRAILESAHVISPTAFWLRGRRHQLPEGTVAAPAGLPAVVVALAEELYAGVHCRVPSRGSAAAGLTNWVGARDFVDRLSEANTGTGTWQGGWLARSVERDGRIIAERHGVRFWVPATEFRADGESLAMERRGAVRLPKEQFELVSGFYLALGDADDTRGAGPIVRIYWNVVPAGAAPLMRLTTDLLNQAGLAFQLKILSEPLRYQRTDPAVLYLPAPQYQTAAPVLARIGEGVARWLKPTISLLVKRLGPGIGLAEDPGDGSSFGEHRCRLLAAIIGDPAWTAVGSSGRSALLSERLSRDGYDLERLYLNPGSRDDYPAFPTAGSW